MELQLAPDEVISKNWVYSDLAEDEHVTKHALTVTNKRVILSEKSDSRIDRREILLDTVVGVATEYVKNQSAPNRKKGIFLIILGVLFFIASVIVVALTGDFLWLLLMLPTVIFLIIGIIFVAGKKIDGKLSVVIRTNIPEQTLTYGFTANTISASTEKNKTLSINISVNLTVAEEIVDCIGALIVAKGTSTKLPEVVA